MSDGLSPPRVFLTFSNSEIESWGIKRDAGGVEYIRHDCTDIPQLYALADIRAAIGDSNGRLMLDEVVDRVRSIVDEANKEKAT